MNDQNRTSLRSVLNLIHQWLAFQVFIRELPGLSVAIGLGEKTLFHEQFGYADLDARQPLAPETRFRIASHSKLFTATAVMRLKAQGRLRLDDPVAEHLDWFAVGDAADQARITIRQLLTHSSGINRDGHTRHWTYDVPFPDNESIRAQARDGLMVYPDGEHWKYSNMGFTLLGEIVAAVTGKSYAEAVTELVLAPLGLGHTHPEFSEDLRAAHALGYTQRIPGEARRVIEHRPAGAMGSATGFSSTAADLLAFYRAHLYENGEFLDDSDRRAMQRVQFKDGEYEWGLGFRIQEIGGLTYACHGGRYPGFITFSGLNQAHGLAIAVLTNAADGPARELFLGISNLMRVGLEMPDYAEIGTPEERAEIDEIAGYYRSFWGVDAYHRIGGKLVGYDPGLDDPAPEMETYDRVGPLTYRLLKGNQYAAFGENTEFIRDSAGRIARVHWPAGSSERWEIPG